MVTLERTTPCALRNTPTLLPAQLPLAKMLTRGTMPQVNRKVNPPMAGLPFVFSLVHRLISLLTVVVLVLSVDRQAEIRMWWTRDIRLTVPSVMITRTAA